MSGLSLIGAAVFALGVVLFIGNVTHLLPTVPLAGWATMAIGGVIFRKGAE